MIDLKLTLQVGRNVVQACGLEPEAAATKDALRAPYQQGSAMHTRIRRLPHSLQRHRRLAAMALLLSVGSLCCHGQARRDLSAQEQLQPVAQQSDYLAVCAIVRDQQEGLREWVEWHKAMGVGRFYIMDYDSSKPTGRAIADYISSGLVDLFYSSNLQETTRYPQLYVYDICLTKFGEYHKWMAFLDVDEFLVLQPQAGFKSLPEFLRGYEDFGGLVANMKVFGSSGFRLRPPGSILRNYLKCLPQRHEENRKVRTLVHTALDPALHMLTPHNVRFRDKFHAVDEGMKPVKESFSTPEVSTEKIAVHKYPLRVVKAAAKKGRKDEGSSPALEETSSYYFRFDREAKEDCITGKLAYAAAMDA